MKTHTFKNVKVPQKIIEILLRTDAPSDPLALFSYYLYVSTCQNNDLIIACTTPHAAESLNCSMHKIIKAKKVLLKLNIIQDFIKRKNGAIEGYYIQLNHKNFNYENANK
jgi:hypothetical protein